MTEVQGEFSPETPIVETDSRAAVGEQPEEVPRAKPKKKGNVRFVTTAEGEVVPDKVRFERSPVARVKAHEALECLLAGNERFRQGTLERCKAGLELVEEVAGDVPRPGTVILACSDSRVPPEIVLDQGLGDCHVVRVAGNVVNDFVMGSVLFAVQHLGCRLVVVLGHSRCSVVASAVQSWARHKCLTRESTTVRTLAEGVQQTLGFGNQESKTPANLAAQLSGRPVVSPFSSDLAQKKEAIRPPPRQTAKPRLMTRLTACCPGGHKPVEGGDSTVSGASTPMQTQGLGVGEGKKSPSNDRSMGRSIGRASINPLAALIGAIGGAVEAVAASGQHEAGLKSLVHKEKKEQDRGWDSDDEDLKKGLQKQDSIEFTRARLAKQRAERKIEALRALAIRDDVDSVIDENTKVSASTILRELVKNLDNAVVQDMEVVAAKYNIESGIVRVLSRNWYHNHTYYNSSD